jgi:hypothetical protein
VTHHALVLRNLAIVSLVVCAGCAEQKIEPVIASSAAEPAYAVTYPEQLTSVATGVSDRQNQVRKVIGTFKEFPGRLKDPDWSRVVEVVERADEVGKSHVYVDRIQRVDGAHVFFETEKDEFTRKVGGSAQYVVKQKSCDVDVTGAVSVAMKDTVDKQLEKELRDVSEAHLVIDRYKTVLKKENVPELEKQADAIEFASYVVHIDLVNDKVRLRRMLPEADKVKGTIDDAIANEQKWQAEKAATAADKKESQDRVAALKKAEVSLESAMTQAKSLDPKLEDELAAITKEYDDALAGLISALKDKRKK